VFKEFHRNIDNIIQKCYCTKLFWRKVTIKIEVKNDNVEQALRALKKKLQREGVFRQLKIKSHYEKPSEKKKREKDENTRRVKKLRKLKARL